MCFAACAVKESAAAVAPATAGPSQKRFTEPTRVVPDDDDEPVVVACATTTDCDEVCSASRDPDVLTAAGIWLAAAEDPMAIEVLGRHLGRTEFLARLDRTDVPAEKTRNLARIFDALAQSPSEAVAAMCRELAHDPEFAQDPDRVIFVLRTAAAVEPMTEDTVALFARTNEIDYAPMNAVLLGNNASPRALALLQSMLEDPTWPLEDRVGAVYPSLLAERTDEDVLAMGTRILSHRLPLELEIVLVEVLLDEPRPEWFGKVAVRPQPRPWTEASPEALRLAASLARRVQGRKRLPAPLRARVGEAARRIEAALDGT
jgi:hypothetical protein